MNEEPKEKREEVGNAEEGQGGSFNAGEKGCLVVVFAFIIVGIGSLGWTLMRGFMQEHGFLTALLYTLGSLAVIALIAGGWIFLQEAKGRFFASFSKKDDD